MLINLLKNAIKFTPAGSITLLVDYTAATQALWVQVKDTGVGIAEEDLPNLFQKFGKLHRTAEINSQGIGLGLMIVK